MSIPQYAKLCKPVQKTEIVDAILALKRKNPTIKNKELSLQLGVHRNTISKYIKFIRQNYVKTPEEIVNKIDDKLDDELEEMSHKDLINYRRSVTPQKIEAHSIEELKVEERHVSIIANLTEYDRAVEEELKRISRTHRTQQSMDTVQP